MQDQSENPIERPGGAPMMWYIFAGVLVVVTVVCLSIFGGAPGHPAP